MPRLTIPWRRRTRLGCCTCHGHCSSSGRQPDRSSRRSIRRSTCTRRATSTPRAHGNPSRTAARRSRARPSLHRSCTRLDSYKYREPSSRWHTAAHCTTRRPTPRSMRISRACRSGRVRCSRRGTMATRIRLRSTHQRTCTRRAPCKCRARRPLRSSRHRNLASCTYPPASQRCTRIHPGRCTSRARRRTPCCTSHASSLRRRSHPRSCMYSAPRTRPCWSSRADKQTRRSRRRHIQGCTGTCAGRRRGPASAFHGSCAGTRMRA